MAGIVLTAVTALALGGCSQVSALAPVGGDALAEVRYGAIDVLLAKGIELLDAPVCSLAGASAAAVSCTGSTTSGETVTVTSSTAPDARLDVTVGARSVYSGPLQAVIDQAARP